MNLSTNLFGPIALLTLFATAAPAFDKGGAGSEGPELGDRVCGRIVSKDAVKNLLGATECSCSGEVSLQLTGIGSYTASKKDALVCESYTLMPDYDAFEPYGELLCEAEKFVNQELVIGTCDNSDCWSFLFFSGGSAVCEFETEDLSGGHMSYKIVGTCKDVTPAS